MNGDFMVKKVLTNSEVFIHSSIDLESQVSFGSNNGHCFSDV
jgi:hypothetical protein